LSVWRRFGHTRGRRGWRPPPICWAGGWLRAVGSSLMWVMTSDLVDRLGPRRILTQRSRRYSWTGIEQMSLDGTLLPETSRATGALE
jgi:hypothetical protein